MITDNWKYKLQAVDIATLAYATAATIAVVMYAGDDLLGWEWLLAANALLAGCALLAPIARRSGKVGGFFADWYAVLLLPALYGEVGVLNVDIGYHHDHAIQQLELAVFGSQVSYRWIREVPSVWLSWVLHSCYLAYFFILYAAPAGLWIMGKRDASRHTIFAIAVTFFICYVVFLFYPVAGPRYLFDPPHNAATDVWPARAAQWILDVGDSWGAAFPSSHVAGSVVATGMALFYSRRLGLVLAPFTAGLILAVVYGQFHYAVDALSGLLLAAAVLAVMQRRLILEPATVPASSVVGVLGTSA